MVNTLRRSGGSLEFRVRELPVGPAEVVRHHREREPGGVGHEVA